MDFTFDRGNDRPALFPRSGRLIGECGEVGPDRVEVALTKNENTHGKWKERMRSTIAHSGIQSYRLARKLHQQEPLYRRCNRGTEHCPRLRRPASACGRRRIAHATRANRNKRGSTGDQQSKNSDEPTCPNDRRRNMKSNAACVTM